MPSDIILEGAIQSYSGEKRFSLSKWKKHYARLYDNGTMLWGRSQFEPKSHGIFSLQSQFIRVYIKHEAYLSLRSKAVLDTDDIDHLLLIVDETGKKTWFLCQAGWITTIKSLISYLQETQSTSSSDGPLTVTHLRVSAPDAIHGSIHTSGFGSGSGFDSGSGSAAAPSAPPDEKEEIYDTLGRCAPWPKDNYVQLVQPTDNLDLQTSSIPLRRRNTAPTPATVAEHTDGHKTRGGLYPDMGNMQYLHTFSRLNSSNCSRRSLPNLPPTDSTYDQVSTLVSVTDEWSICEYRSGNVHRANGWVRVSEVPYWRDGGTAWTTYGAGFILAGAANSKCGQNVLHIDINDKVQRILPQLPKPVSSPGITHTARYVYVLAGQEFTRDDHGKMRFIKSTQTRRLRIGDGEQWETVQPMLHAVTWPITLHKDRKVYAIGGKDIRAPKTVYAQVYDEETDQWTKIRDLPERCTAIWAGGVVLNDRVIVFTPNSCISYSEGYDHWEWDSYPSLGTQITPVVHEDHVVACVWNDKRKQLGVYKYSFQNNSWLAQSYDVTRCIGAYFFFAYKT